MSKNIWILNHYAISPDMAGGTRHYDLGRELVKRGHKVTIFTSGFDYVKKKYIKVQSGDRYNVEDYNEVRFVWLNTVPYYINNWRRILNMISYGIRVLSIAKNFRRPDVVIGSSVHPFAVIAAWWLAKRYKAKFIFEVRDLWPQTPIEMGVIKANGIPAKLLYNWEKFMYINAKKIIVLMPNAKEYIKKYNIDSQKIVWICNGVNLQQFDNAEPIEPSSEIVKDFIKYRDKFKVIYTGAHGPANGLENIVNAANLLSKTVPDVQFFLVGDGIEKKKLIQKVKENNINNIVFLNSVSKLQVPSILQKADLLLICGRNLELYKYGISPNKLFDYLASKKPIIMSGNFSNNIVRDAKAGVTVEPEDAKALAEGILKIKKMSSKERIILGINGRAYVEKYYSTRVLGEKLDEIL